MPHKILQAGWLNFKRNSYLSVAAVGVMALVLSIFVALLAFRFLTTELVGVLENKVDITAYFETTTNEEDILEIKEELETIDSVESVTYTSSEQAKIDFLGRRGNDEDTKKAFELLEANPLKASLNISAIDPTYYESIAEFLNNARFSGIINKVDFFE